MAGHLKFFYVCLSIFLLVLPLVCSEYEENNEKNDMDELLQNLLKAEKERRQSDDTNAEGSRGTEQGDTNDDGNEPNIETQKLPNGVIKNDVSVNNELHQEIFQDCENKYELILFKNDDNAGGYCYLHKMNDRIYQKDCLGTETEGEIKIDYTLGDVIENTTLLSSIKGIEGCMGKDVTELHEASVKKRDFDEYEKRLAERKGCNVCGLYQVQFRLVCVQKSGWWFAQHCVKQVLESNYACRYKCL